MNRIGNALWLWPDGLVWRVTRQFTSRSRRARFRVFMDAFEPTEATTILDVGVGEGEGRALNFFEAWYPWPKRITAVAQEDLPGFRHAHPDVTFVVGDGTSLPFRDRTFDIAFSNAVLEHVGSIDDQKRFVSELCRVADRVFFSTPNRWFPVDAHTLIPFAHWLPLDWRNAIYRRLGREYYASEERLHLLSRRELERLVPQGCRVTFRAQRVLGIAVNWNVLIETR